MGVLKWEELGLVLDHRRFYQMFLQILEPEMRVLFNFIFLKLGVGLEVFLKS